VEQSGATRPREEQGRFGAFPSPSSLRRLHWRGEELKRALRDWLERELAERAGFQWLAAAFATGALIYLALPREPLFMALLVPALVVGLAANLTYRRGAGWRMLTVLAVLLAGMTAAKFRVDELKAPQIGWERYVEATGRVIDRENPVERRPRIVLSHLESTFLTPNEMPERIRVTLGERYELPPLGSRIAIRAMLMPIGGPVVPGGYDPHRTAFFERIGGTGFLLGSWTLVEAPPSFSLDLAIGRIRSAIVARIMAAQPGEEGAVAAALLVGERSSISAETNENLRISGLAHILSISGLHMMLVAGTAFFTVRALLALSARLALTWPIRKWAAIAALLVATAYLAVSGGNVATVRAYVMAAIMFAAILVGRPAISMRNLAIATFMVVALEPESVVEPGFQMSFAAVMALIAAWEAWHERRVRRLMDDDAVPGLYWLRVGWRAVIGVGVTTLVAGAATAPFAAYHFERIANYSLLGNLLAAPFVSIIIMPFGLLALVVMPLGLEALPLAVMAWGVRMLLAIADFVAGLPGAEVVAPPIAPLSLLLIVAGMLWLCLWRLRWRFLGVPTVLAGLLVIPVLIDRADVLVAPDGTAIAVRDETGILRVSGSRAGSYTIDQFFDEEGGPPASGAELREGVRCDALACVLDATGGLVVSHVTDAAAFAEDCRRAAIIVTPLTVPSDCRAQLIVDQAALARGGAHAIRIDEAAGEPIFRITAQRSAFPRPWELAADPR
jgi:competence protein ComEC